MVVRDLVFFSYRHDEQGEYWLSEILQSLAPYALMHEISTWSDQDINAGDLWDERIQSAIDRTRVAVLLVNQAFFGSPYICDKELPRLVQAACDGELRLLCVPIGACDSGLLDKHGVSAFQFTHAPQDPMKAATNAKDERFAAQVAVKIHRAFGTATAPLPPASTPSRRGKGVVSSASLRDGQPPKLGPLFGVPDLDDLHYVERSEDLAALKTQLLHGDEIVQGLDSKATRVGFHGMGGMGKSVLAQALARDPEVRRAFADGVAWVSLGQQPNLLGLQNQILQRFAPSSTPQESSADARDALRTVVGSRRVLIVVDDIWDARHYGAFDVVGARGRLLLTTRDASVLTQLRVPPHELCRLDTSLARQLLANWSGANVATLPAEADEVVRQVGGLPLALALAGAQAAEGVPWSTLADQLKLGRIRFLDHPYDSVYDSIGRSVDALPIEERQRYLELAVFPEDFAVPFATVKRLWKFGGQGEAECERLVARLSRKALLTLHGTGQEAQVSLHDLLFDFLQARCDDLPALHGRLLDSHRRAMSLPDGPTGWAHMPRDEPYLWHRLSHHLSMAGLGKQLEDALLDVHFLQARIESVTVCAPNFRVDLASLLQDFAVVDRRSPAQVVGRAIRRSSHVLAKWPEQLAWQLFGRLGESDQPRVRELALLARNEVSDKPLQPTRAALDPPGSMEMLLAGHEDKVCGAVLLPDGRRALSWSDDGTLRLWNLEQGGSAQVLTGHERPVYGALPLPDGRRALLWGCWGTLALCDIEQGGSAQVLTERKSRIGGALLLPTGRRALSWWDDGTLQLWDLEHGGSALVLSWHTDAVDGVRLLPDGRRALSWSKDGSLRLLDLEHGGSLQVLERHMDSVDGALQLLPDGKWALWRSEDGTWWLRDLEPGTWTQKQLRMLNVGKNWVNGELLLPDGRRVLSRSNNGPLRLWDLERGTPALVLIEGRGGVAGALPLADGRRALSWSRIGTLALWDLEQGGSSQVQGEPTGVVTGALQLPDARQVLLWTFDGSLVLFDLENVGRAQVLHGHKGPVRGALLLRDGQRALSWSDDGTLRLWDLEQGRGVQVLSGHEGAVAGALLSPDSQRALSWSEDRTLRLWGLEQGSNAQALSGQEGGVVGTFLLPDGQRALSWSDDRTLRLWDLEQGGSVQLLSGHEGAVNGALLLGDGRHALSWSKDRTLRLWDLEHGSSAKVLAGHEGAVIGATMMPDGQRVMSWSADHSVRLWDIEQGGSLRVQKHPLFSIVGAMLLPNSRSALVWFDDWPSHANPERPMWLLNIEKGGVRVLNGHEGLVNGALQLPDGQRALSWSDDQTLRLWDLGQGSSSQLLAGHKGGVNGALLLQDGRQALSWSQDGTLRLWDLEHGGNAQVLSGHKGKVTGALMLPDGWRALSWSEDGTLRVWNLKQVDCALVLSGHEGWVVGALVLPDGRNALSWSHDHTIRLWDLEQGAEVGVHFTDAEVTAVAMSSDGMRAVAGDRQGYLHALRIQSSLGQATTPGLLA